MNIVKKLSCLFVVVALFFCFSNVSLAYEYSYTTDSVLSEFGVPSASIDNDLSTWFELHYRNDYTYHFDDMTITGYFIKEWNMHFFYFLKDGVSVKASLKESISKDGGTYYIYNEPVEIDGLYMVARGDGNGARLYEFEIFSAPQVKCELLDKNSNSLKIKYYLVCSSVDAIKYEVYLNDNIENTLSDSEYEFKNLKPDTSYNVKIKAFISDTEYIEDSFVYETSPAPLVLLGSNRSDKLNKKDSVIYTFNKDISTFTNNSITDFDSYNIDADKLTINLNNDYETNVNMNFTVTDIDGEILTISKRFKTIKKGGILMTFDFSFISDWTDALVPTLKTSSIAVIVSVLGLAGVIIGGFFLIGLVKKAVGKAK